MDFGKFKITEKILFMLGLTVLVAMVTFSFAAKNVYLNQLQNEARTLSEMVVAFRGWVAHYGTVWVNDEGKSDFLGEHEAGFYSKNPALATRELSDFAEKSQMRTSFTVTSDKYRNPKNKPDPFEEKAISHLKITSSDFYEGFEPGIYRYAKPLIVKEACLKCHGDPQDAPAVVIEKYGDKAAFGYKLGEVRGIISVRIPTEGFLASVTRVLEIWHFVLFLLTVVFCYIFAQATIVKPLRHLAKVSDELSHGKMGVQLISPELHEKPRDEVQILAQSISRLKKSVLIMTKLLKKK